MRSLNITVIDNCPVGCQEKAIKNGAQDHADEANAEEDRRQTEIGIRRNHG